MPTMTKKHFEAIAQTIAKKHKLELGVWVDVFRANNPAFSERKFRDRIQFLINRQHKRSLYG